MSRIIKSTVAQTIDENKKIIGLKSVRPIEDFLSSSEDFPEESHGSQLIEEATREAQRMIQAAKEKSLHAEEELAQEKEKWIIEREQLMQEAYNTGFLQGEEEGRHKGYQEYRKQLIEANEINERNKQLYEDYIQRAEKVILGLGLACAEKIMNQKLEEEPQHFLPIVERGLKEVRDLPHIQIHVHPTKHKLLVDHKTELEVMFPTDVQCFIYANDDLHDEECYIETNQGRVIVSVDTQLKELKLKLYHLLEGDEE